VPSSRSIEVDRGRQPALADVDRRWVEVERRGQTPAFAPTPEEPGVAQVIVEVRDQDVERQPPGVLEPIGIGASTVPRDRVGGLQVAGVLAVGAIEAADDHGDAPVDLEDPRGRVRDARARGEAQGDRLAPIRATSATPRRKSRSCKVRTARPSRRAARRSARRSSVRPHVSGADSPIAPRTARPVDGE